MTEFLREINWSPLWISLKTGLAATVIAFFLGVFCARKIMKLRPGAKAVLDGILTLPLVLPPTVAGFFLLMIFLYKNYGKKLHRGFFFGLCLTEIFVFRFFVEFLKENQVDFENSMSLNMGQWLSVPFVIIGVYFMFFYGKKKTQK